MSSLAQLGEQAYSSVSNGEPVDDATIVDIIVHELKYVSFTVPQNLEALNYMYMPLAIHVHCTYFSAQNMYIILSYLLYQLSIIK